jgi:hypothetical protein
MARGAHRSPQFLKSGKRTKSKNKTLKLLQANEQLLAKFK